MRKKKGLLLGLILCSIVLLALPVSAAGSKKNAGAKIPSYSKVVEITVDKDNFANSWVKALKTAEKKASTRTQYKIIIPPGTHYMEWFARVPSNVYIYAKGATIKCGRQQFFVTADNTKTKNIVIDGGTWTTLNQKKSYAPDSAPFRMMGVTNAVMKNMTIKCNRRAHIIEVANMNGFTIKNCVIEGSGISAASVQNKEAIQLDVATADAMPSYTKKSSMLNGKGCHSVLIEDCSITNCQRGIGSHSGIYGNVEKKPYTNIIVRDCTLKYLKGEGIFAQNWRSATIQNNTVYLCRRAGVFLLEAYNVNVTKNKVTDIRKFTGAKKTQYGANATGVLIWRSTGNYVTGNKVSKYTEKTVIQDTVSSNTIKNNKGSNKR